MSLGSIKLQPSTRNAVLFALRTTIASLVALGIAMWMELGQPQWAPMTVWIVARDSRGMSMSKGRWRIAGTLVGMVGGITMIGLVPQHPWLFFPMLALWMGVCSGFASMTDNFRAYALVLAGYTGAIIAMHAVTQPGEVFHVAMQRGTYIILGVVCEMVAGMVSVPGAAKAAQKQLEGDLTHLLENSAQALGSVIRREKGSEARLSLLLGALQRFNDQLEFIRIDTQHIGRHADRAYMTLGRVAVVLSRGLGLRSRILSVGRLSPSLKDELEEFASGMDAIAPLLLDASLAEESLRHAETMLGSCRKKLALYLPRDDSAALQEGIVLTGVEVLLEDLCAMLSSHYAGTQHIAAPKARGLHRHPDWGMAWVNGTRTFVAMIWGAFVWEVTAWSNGGTYLALIAVACARFSLFDDMVLASRFFFYGACVAVLASIVPVFIIMPMTSNFEVLALILGTLLFLGGLALRAPQPFVVMGAGYTMFLPWVMELDNNTHIDEITWVNTSVALLLALFSGVVSFRVIFPFTLQSTWRMLRRQLFKGMKRLSNGLAERQTEYDWVDDTTQQMEQTLRLAGKIPQESYEAVLRGTLSVMTVGRNLLMIRNHVQERRLPLSALQEAELLVGQIVQMDAEGAIEGEDYSEQEFREEQGELWMLFHQTLDIEARRDLALALGSLRIIRVELLATRNFLKKNFTFVETQKTLAS
ncbi:FUSC family protein [Saccharibacter floricola]|uniref:FUSC family protein n=1 Tax=Saccharibacter floricola DSM 15669 TaxID=1123227 RepID=A0ABQ0NYT1_9PROT|nr:FUSC family protein [Saccharibacter floricola]GBQ06839.1 hypothetical protein AA15669_1113 [Saccharibacter floricola DSM 15669]